jgi:RHS repeat-associated protein
MVIFARQLTTRTRRGCGSGLGAAMNAARVSVNTNQAYLKHRDLRAELAMDNAANRVWLEITRVAMVRVGSGHFGVSNITGEKLVLESPELLGYEKDGNLVRHGRWVYRWDAENRRVRGMSYGASDRAGWRRVDWAYDALGRRTRQTSCVLSNGVWVVTDDLNLVRDPVWFGRHVAESSATNHALVRSYVWGLDLSETMDGAGGVGGLLWVKQYTGPSVGAHFCAYDGNGNISALIAALDGAESARYEYGPFGELIRLTGPMGKGNPFRFSTKRTHDTTDLVLYEYRVYSPSTGRWLSRDPIAEVGFALVGRPSGGVRSARSNLYRGIGNHPLSAFDRLALYEYEWEDIFTHAEKQAILNSIARVKQRALALIKQMDDNIRKLSKLCPCPAYGKLIKNLEHVKRILEGMVSEIEDPGRNLEIYRADFPGNIMADYWNSSVPWYDDTLTLDNGWFHQSSDEKDSTMFHEITHGQGTEDEDFSNPYNNAHALESLMHIDKENWIHFRSDKRMADRLCSRTGS